MSSVKNLPLPLARSSAVEWLRMLSLTGIVGILYSWHGGPSLLFLLIALGLVLLGGLLLQLLGPRSIRLERTLTPPRAAAGDTIQVEVKVSFTARLPLPWMTITDYWGDRSHRQLLFPGLRRSFSYVYQLEEMPRGFHRLQGCRVVWGDLPCWFTGRNEPQGGQIFRVLPAPLYCGNTQQGGSDLPAAMMISRRGGQGSGPLQESRHYLPGDPLSRIHWKNSARTGMLQSKMPEREKAPMTCVVLSNHPESYELPAGALVPRARRSFSIPAFEKAVSAAAGLLLRAEASGAYIQLFSGGWPEGLARHEGMGQIPGRVLDILTGLAPDGATPLARLLEEASASWIPGMTVTVITGRIDQAAAKVLARFLVQGVKVELYFSWDLPAPVPGGSAVPSDIVARTVGDSLARLGAVLYSLDAAVPAYRYKEVDRHEASGRPSVQ